MSDFTPIDADDTVIPVAGGVTASPATTAPTPLDHDDEVIPAGHEQAAQPEFAGALTQEQADALDARLGQMWADPKISGDQIRAFLTTNRRQIQNQQDQDRIDARDAMIKRGEDPAGTATFRSLPGQGDSTQTLDNRDTSQLLGFRDGLEHVGENIVGGLGWVGNKIGLSNQWRDDVHDAYAKVAADNHYQGGDLGKLGGELAATVPLTFLTPEVEGAGLLTRGAIAAGDGALQSALTTNATTPGGVLRDTAIGGILGAGLGTASHALSKLASTPTEAALAGRQVLDVADRLGVQPLPADVGGTLTKGATAAGEAGLLSHGPIRKAADAYLDSLQGVRDDAARSVLPAGVEPKTLYGAALDVLHGVGGLGDYETRSAEAGGKLYDKAAELAGNTQISADRARAAVNELVEQGERTPGNVPGLDALRTLRDDLTPTPGRTAQPTIFDREFGGANLNSTPGNPATFSVDTLRRLRTSFGDNFDANQRAAKEAAKAIWGPLSEDIDAGLRAAGKDDAADAYRVADQHWEQRGRNLDEIIDPILSNRSHEQLASTIEGLSRNNSDLLGRGLDLMEPDQAAHVKAAIIGNLGKASPGTQNATNDAFSIAQFGTDWAKLSQGVKDHLLAGHEGQQLQDLATLAEATKVSGRYRNTSGTARSSHALDILSGMGTALAGGAGGVVAGVKTGGASLAAEYGLGKLMSSPAVGRAIVRAGEIRPVAKTSTALTKLGQRVAPSLHGDDN